MNQYNALLRCLAIAFLPFVLIGPPAIAAPDTFSVPAMELTPRKGVAGQTYLIDLFMQVCVANKDHIENIAYPSSLTGWHTETIRRTNMIRITTDRVGWPEIEAQKTEYGGMCAIVWTIDPNEGIGSVQAEFEKNTHVRLDGNRSTNSPNQTVFNGFGSYDQRGFPQLLLNENISEKRASFQVILYGKWAK